MPERVDQAAKPRDEQERLRVARALTLGRIISEGLNLAISCRCGHRRVVDPEPLFDLCKIKVWDTHVLDLMNKLRCSKCGQKWPSVKATTDERNAPPIGPTTQEEFRRMVRRHR